MKSELLILIIIIFSFEAIPQTDSSFILYWGTRDLMWEDFLGVPPDYSEYSSEISYGIGYRSIEKTIGDMDILWLEAYCFMDRGSSWIREGYKNSNVLLYNQTIFDLVELYTRNFQEDINNLSGSTNIIIQRVDELLREYNSRIKNRVAILYSDTQGGLNSERVNFWYHDTKLKLSQQERHFIPEYTLSRFGLGLTFDLGYGVLTGNSTEYFTNNFNLSFGFDVAYRPLILYLRGILGFNSVKKEFMYNDKTWEENLSTGIFVGELTVGYPFPIMNDFCLTPFAGIGVVEFTVPGNDEKYKEHTIDDFSGVFGLNLDYSFSRTLNLLNDFIFREKSNWVIRTRLTISPFYFNDQIEGTAINFTIGVGGFTNPAIL